MIFDITKKYIEISAGESGRQPDKRIDSQGESRERGNMTPFPGLKGLGVNYHTWQTNSLPTGKPQSSIGKSTTYGGFP